ncbi:MAG: mobile mystery protein B [Bacteroidetes bacterium]|nr:mobile mystery protein B [Bacteroidota bacterium]
MGLNFTFVGGQTFLNEEEKSDLKIRFIETQNQLNEYEQYNIEEAINWSLNQKFSLKQFLSEKFILRFHHKMFNKVWKWAGQYRKSNKNIGIDKTLIKNQVLMIIDDCLYQINNNIYKPDEIAIRFKHKLVSIHPFCNGNGRFSRIIADIIVSHFFDLSVFSWGQNEKNRRIKYLMALKLADNFKYDDLLKFARN